MRIRQFLKKFRRLDSPILEVISPSMFDPERHNVYVMSYEYGDDVDWCLDNYNHEYVLRESVEANEQENLLKKGVRKITRAGKRVWKGIERSVKGLVKERNREEEEVLDERMELTERERELTSWERLKEERMKMKARHREEELTNEERKREKERQKKERNWEKQILQDGQRLAREDREDMTRWELEEQMHRRAKTV